MPDEPKHELSNCVVDSVWDDYDIYVFVVSEIEDLHTHFALCYRVVALCLKAFDDLTKGD